MMIIMRLEMRKRRVDMIITMTAGDAGDASE